MDHFAHYQMIVSSCYQMILFLFSDNGLFLSSMAAEVLLSGCFSILSRQVSRFSWILFCSDLMVSICFLAPSLLNLSVSIIREATEAAAESNFPPEMVVWSLSELSLTRVSAVLSSASICLSFSCRDSSSLVSLFFNCSIFRLSSSILSRSFWFSFPFCFLAFSCSLSLSSLS